MKIAVIVSNDSDTFDRFAKCHPNAKAVTAISLNSILRIMSMEESPACLLVSLVSENPTQADLGIFFRKITRSYDNYDMVVYNEIEKTVNKWADVFAGSSVFIEEFEAMVIILKEAKNHFMSMDNTFVYASCLEYGLIQPKEFCDILKRGDFWKNGNGAVKVAEIRMHLASSSEMITLLDTILLSPDEVESRKSDNSERLRILTKYLGEDISVNVFGDNKKRGVPIWFELMQNTN